MHSRANNIQLLARFRSEIRRFLRFSEEAALAAGLQPQHHQLLLQIAGAPLGTVVNIGYVAEAMSLRHHSVVELTNRCETAGFIRRTQDVSDRRQVVLELTREGQRALSQLSDVHAQQLCELAPGLLEALTALIDTGSPRLSGSGARNRE